MDIYGIREEYTKAILEENNINSSPFVQFEKWFEETLKSKVNEPNAMHLSTISENMRPVGRVVLLKFFDTSGLCFFTNYNSRKASNLAFNPFGALTFFWPELERQIRIEGTIDKMSEAESITYFSERPRKSQLGAWASPQSEEIESRAVLEENYKKLEEKFEGKQVPRPEHWGGYRLRPDYFEFWQGRRSRLHDRIIYKMGSNALWEIKRIAP
jgi:pyridoxamine 5'-phosphate oxidase